jgi:hypothetical protein
MNINLSYKAALRIALFAVLTHFFFNKAIAYSNTTASDTAYYFNERGKLLYVNPYAGKRASYVIKTRKEYHQVFHDIPAHDTTVAVSELYSTATVISIQRHVARKVEKLIRKGMIDDPLVTENIIPLLDKSILRRMYDNIQARCNSSESKKFKEHGGVLLPDGTITCITGEISDPRWFAGASLYIKQQEQALVYYHNHPCGCVQKNSDGSEEAVEPVNPNRVSFSSNKQTEWICYIQGPSKQDQEAVGKGIGYVFGMSGNSALIYIYDREGVKATLPVSFLKKVRIEEVRKIETYTAGNFSAIGMPYLF